MEMHVLIEAGGMGVALPIELTGTRYSGQALARNCHVRRVIWFTPAELRVFKGFHHGAQVRCWVGIELGYLID